MRSFLNVEIDLLGPTRTETHERGPSWARCEAVDGRSKAGPDARGCLKT
jgi:hypothetical protein